MARTVFWSWQSDQPPRETRNLIRDALTAAIGSVAAEFDEAERPEIDHDTKDLPGSPDIVAAILAKIDAAAVFVADVTPIAVSSGGKHVANPNVLIELGYAKRALGLDRVIQVWNTALTGAKPEDLPFDMRQKRAPLSYDLPVGASTEDLRRVRTQLQDRLTMAIRAALKVVPGTPAPVLPWRPSVEGDPSIWIAPGTPIRLNEGWGSGTKTFTAGGRWYVRILPTTFDPDILDTGVHGPVVGFYGGFSWGHATGGLMTYSGSVRADVPPELDAASMWFRDTGEIWAFQTRVGGEYQGRQVFYGDHVPEKWAETLADGLKKLADHGGGAPCHVRLGVTGLDGLCWPDVQSYGGEPPVALESAYEVEFTVRDHQPASWREPFASAWNGLRRIFSMPSPEPAVLDKTIAKAIR